MDCGKVKVEDPAKPDRFVILYLLTCIVMPDSEVIGNIEKIVLIFGCKDFLKLWSEVFQDIS
jgi:hypothetical protein